MVEDVTIQDILFFATETWIGGDLMLTWNGSDQARNVVVENVKSIGGGRGFLAAKHGGSALIHNMEIRDAVLYHNKVFDVIIESNRYQGAGGGAIHDLYMENIKVQAEPVEIGRRILGRSEQSDVERWTLNQLTAKGEVLNSLDETQVKTNEHVKQIVFNQPALFLTLPYRGSVLDVKDKVTLQAKPLGFDKTATVSFRVNGQEMGTSNASTPYISWTPKKAGDYTIQAVAGDNVKSAQITVIVE